MFSNVLRAQRTFKGCETRVYLINYFTAHAFRMETNRTCEIFQTITQGYRDFVSFLKIFSKYTFHYNKLLFSFYFTFPEWPGFIEFSTKIHIPVA